MALLQALFLGIFNITHNDQAILGCTHVTLLKPTTSFKLVPILSGLINQEKYPVKGFSMNSCKFEKHEDIERHYNSYMVNEYSIKLILCWNI